MNLVTIPNTIEELTFATLVLMRDDLHHLQQQASDNDQCDALRYAISDNDSSLISERLQYLVNEEYMLDEPECADQAEDQIAALTLMLEHFDYAVAIDRILSRLK